MARHGLGFVLGVLVWTVLSCEGGGSPPPGGANGASSAASATAVMDPVLDRNLRELRLGVGELRKELEEKGEILRQPLPAEGSQTAAGGKASGSGAGDPNAVLAGKVKAALLKDPEVPAMSLEVEAEAGRVTLTGRTATWEQLQRTLLAALRVPGARAVVSKVTVEPDDGSGATKGDDRSAPR